MSPIALALFNLFDVIFFTDRSSNWSTTVYETYPTEGLHPPTLTVCNYNRIRNSKAEKYGFTEEMRNYFFSHFWVNYIFGRQFKYMQKEKELYSKWRKEMNLTFPEIVEKLAATCQETFLYARTAILNDNGKLCNGTFERDMVKVEPFLSYEFGQCYQVIFNPNITVKETGSYGSATLILDPQTQDYIDDTVNNFHDEGIAIQLSYERKVVPGHWIRLPAGYHSWIGMEMIEKRTRDKQFSSAPCDQKAKMMTWPQNQYSPNACMLDCRFSEMAAICGCYPMVKTEKYPICELEQWDTCYRMMENNIELMKKAEKCRAACTEPCFDRKIDSTVSVTGYPSNKVKERLQTELIERLIYDNSTDWKNKKFIALDLYYKTISVKVTERYQRMSLNAFIGQLGGQLGLWTGMSIITVEHAIICFIKAVYNWYKKDNQLKSDEHNQSLSVKHSVSDQ